MDPIRYPDLPCNAVICRYGELATKGQNRIHFERLLIASIRRTLEDLGALRIMRERGRIFVRHADRLQPFVRRDCEVLRDRIPRIHGLVSASPGFLVAPELAAIEAAVFTSFPAVYAAFAAQMPEPSRIPYATRVNRNWKDFPLRSVELEIRFAERLLAEYPRLQVDLRRPALCIDLEIRRDRAFVSYERIQGPGGLPCGTGGRVLALLSGGIDSPVACYQLMKRGCTLDFVTFHSEPYTSPELVSKVSHLVRLLNAYQTPGRLIAINLLTAQKVIRDRCTPRFRTILYRRLMVRLAAATAWALGDEALATGDNIGQVASQTLTNLRAVSAATERLILRPLLTNDKMETTALAARIGTLAVSEKDVPDSCTVFAVGSPATAARLDLLENEESSLDLPALLRQCVTEAFTIHPDTLERSPVPRLAEALERSLAAGRF